MDRLDSLLLVAPVAWALLAWVVPPADPLHADALRGGVAR